MVYTVNGGGETDEKKGTPWKGVVFSFLASLPFFNHGVGTTELASSSQSGHFIISEAGIPWNATAYVLAAIFSAPVYCYVADRYGRKVGLFVVNLAQGASCIPLFLPRDFATVIALHVVAGISIGGLFTIIPIYIKEINSLATKSFSLSLMMVLTTFGYLMEMVADVESLMYVVTGMVVVQFLSMLVLVESPCYLVKRGKMGLAREAISRLYCLESNNSNLTKKMENLKEESERAKSKGKLNIIGILKNPIYRDQTKIGIILCTTMMLCGSIAFLDESKTLLQLRIPEPNKTVLLLCLCAGSLFTVLVISFLERKYLMTLGYVIMVLSMGVLGVYTQMDLTVTSLRWLASASSAVLVFGYGAVWALPYLTLVEIYNFEIRSTMIGVLFSYGQIIKLIHIHTYKYIEDYIGLYTLFYIFTIVNMYGGVYSLFAIPDLKNKTDKQIERQMRRIPLLSFGKVAAKV